MGMGDISGGLLSAGMTRSEFGESDDAENYFENNTATVSVRVINHRIDTINFAGSTLIWGNTTFGSWGSYNWGNGGNTSFILGNTQAGILGTSKLGTQQSSPVRLLENYIWIDYFDDFTGSASKDTGSTTAIWDLSGSVTFGVGSVLQTINLGSDIQLSTTKFTNALVDLSGNYYWNTIGSISSDGGTTWTPITAYGVEQAITSTTGSEPVIKIYDGTGSAVLEEINAYFHTSDII